MKVAVDHCLKIISVWNIEKEKTHLIIKESGAVFWMLIITLLLLYNIYVPKASIYLKNIKVPYEFKVERVNGQINMDNIFEDRNIGTIKDINLINEIYSEADKKQYKNIRNLDLINFEFEGKGRYPYYIIIPVYEGIGNSKIARLKDGFIERFEVSDSGQIVFNDEYIEFGIFRSISPKYRIHLDDSTKKKLVDAINSLK